tara:strand:+ start:148 stop:486 length:339 start_codon:yes stop_codon:yes gene_type:complete
MINYNWDCKTVDAYPQNGVYTDLVYNVHWKVTGISDELKPDGTNYSVTNIGTQELNVSNVTNFIPFEDLTNEIIVAWTQEAMGSYQISSIEDSIASQINSLVVPASVTLTIG